VGILSPFVDGICTSLCFLMFTTRLPAGSLFGARFGGVSVTVLSDDCDSCDISEDDMCE
jgi:hypothetical protein